VPTRLGEYVVAVKCEDVGKNVVRELRCGWLRNTCQRWVSMTFYEAEGTYGYVEQSVAPLGQVAPRGD
jgi:hypothetical protein